MKKRAAAFAACAMLVAASPALATGGDEPGEMQDAMASAPARVLAQQALATLDVTGDADEARERIDAALESKDRDDVDVELLRAADEALDGGDREEAVALLNRALGGGPVPVGEEEAGSGAVSEEALHNAGRAYEPNETAQEIVALVAGLALLALAGLLLLRRPRRRGPAAA